jgi:hypothetical protein
MNNHEGLKRSEMFRVVLGSEIFCIVLKYISIKFKALSLKNLRPSTTATSKLMYFKTIQAYVQLNAAKIKLRKQVHYQNNFAKIKLKQQALSKI